MRYQILATDFDGTLAHHGVVDEPMIRALESFLATGRRSILVTGRELPDLKAIFPRLDLFEWVVAENGGLLYCPSTKEEEPLADPPPIQFVEALRKANCASVSVGRVIVATWEPCQRLVLELIHDLGLELHVIFNKSAVMVLPSGVNKASGMAAALKRMGLSPHNVVGVGDAENDHAFLRMCEFSAAVANALPVLKESVDWVTPGNHGIGVMELIERMTTNDLADFDGHLARHHLPIGASKDGEVRLSPYGSGVLIAGPSASGKSTVTTQIIETLARRKYQFCLIDPEGDYENFEEAIVLGGPKGLPNIAEIMQLLENPETNVVVSLTGMPIADRPLLFLELLPHLLKMRARRGRPHWLVFDEAHHLMPAKWLPPARLLPEHLNGMLLITVHPDLLSPAVRSGVDTVLATGGEALEILRQFAPTPQDLTQMNPPSTFEKGDVALWTREAGGPRWFKPHPCKLERRRHRRKYAEGELPPERSFYFQGPKKKLNLRAQNLILFLQISAGVDDATWDYHLRRHDYSRWFREVIKDENLAAHAERIEGLAKVKAADSRELIRAAVEQDYSLPASLPLPVPGAQ